MGLLSTLRCLLTTGRGVVVGLPDASDDDDPIRLFGEWFEAGRKSGLFLPEAVSLSTATRDGRPSSRMVLLKHFDDDGFVFYTNYDSRKASEIEENPHVALLMHWSVLERQLRIEGTAARTDEATSEAYFRSRPRGSRIGAWASRQSEELDSREDLARMFRETESRFDGSDDIPLPPFWGGYRVIPSRMEFWQGRANRLHDRLIFERSGSSWQAKRLQP